MATQHNPGGIAPPFSAYSHGIEVPAGARWLHISGQVGVTPDGKLAGDLAAQAEQAWRNIGAILESAGMDAGDLVKLTVFLTGGEGIPVYRESRDRFLSGATPASTLILVAGLANPDWEIEIEAIAAKAD